MGDGLTFLRPAGVLLSTPGASMSRMAHVITGRPPVPLVKPEPDWGGGRGEDSTVLVNGLLVSLTYARFCADVFLVSTTICRMRLA